MNAKTLLTTFLSLCILFFNSCANKIDDKEENTLYVDLENAGNVSLWDIFSHIELIPLETTNESLIKDINKLILYDDIYYLLDYRNSTILMFDSSGNFLYKINDKGDGPQEYLDISDFEINKENNMLSVLAPVNNSMYEYDLKGNFTNKYKLPDIRGAYKSFFSLNNDTVVFFTFDYDNRIKLYSKSENRIVKELLPETDNMLDKFSQTEFPYANYLHRASSNKLLKIENNGDIVDGYTWDFGKLNNTEGQIEYIAALPGNDLHKYIHQFMDTEIVNQIMILQAGNSKYLFTQLWRKGKHVSVFHDKKNSKSHVFEKTIENATFHPLSWNNQYVIGYYCNEWGEKEGTLPDAILDDKNIKIRDEWDEEDNPILIKYYFKE